MKRIPKTFTLGPHVITVSVVTAAQMAAIEEDEPLGLWVRDENRLYVQRVRKGFSKSMQLQTFWHEFMHATFETLGYDKLSENEQLVDQCGLMLQQAHQTFTF